MIRPDFAVKAFGSNVLQAVRTQKKRTKSHNLAAISMGGDMRGHQTGIAMHVIVQK
jgi:hypothetical protein